MTKDAIRKLLYGVVVLLLILIINQLVCPSPSAAGPSTPQLRHENANKASNSQPVASLEQETAGLSDFDTDANDISPAKDVLPPTSTTSGTSPADMNANSVGTDIEPAESSDLGTEQQTDMVGNTGGENKGVKTRVLTEEELEELIWSAVNDALEPYKLLLRECRKYQGY